MTRRQKRRSSWALRATTIVLTDMSAAPAAGLRTTPTEAHAPFDRDSFALAVRDGIEPGGTHHLDPWMPRWALSDPQIDALIEYLKEL